MKIRKAGKYVVSGIFIILICIPLIFNFCSAFFQIKLDVSMKGYFETYDKPEFTIISFKGGQYQKDYEAWLNHTILPRNLYVKLYNQLQYSLFDQGSRIIGKNKNIFEYLYISRELCLDGDDYSIPEKDNEMQEFVDCLERVNKKLQNYGKYLIVYTAPSKSHWYKDDIPDCYMVQAVDGIRGIDSFREKISKTDVTYIDTESIVKGSQYPVFYNTGIHWSRTAEQMVSAEIIKKIKEETQAGYKDLKLGDVEYGSIPYWRDSDVFDLTNIIYSFKKPTYYQYKIKKEYPEKYEKMRMLLQGDSFADGLIHDYFDTYLGNEIYFIRRDETDLDIQYCLDQTDLVVIEMNEILVPDYSWGFVQNLDNFLDNYIPNKEFEKEADINLNFHTGEGLCCSKGFSVKENAEIWMGQDAVVTLKNENIHQKGLELYYCVDESILSDRNHVIYIYVNQKLLRTINVEGGGESVIIIPADELESEDKKTYDIEIMNDFISDSDDLLKVYYIGEVI